MSWLDKYQKKGEVTSVNPWQQAQAQYNKALEEKKKAEGIAKAQKIINPDNIPFPAKIRQNLGNMDTFGGYEKTSLSAIANAALKGEGVDFEEWEQYEPGAAEQDAFRLYLGNPQKYDTFKPSKYKPGALELKHYREHLPDSFPTSLKGKINELGHWSNLNGLVPNSEDYISFKPWDDMVMGKHTVKEGEDKDGYYVDYQDYWNLDPDRHAANYLKKTVASPMVTSGLGKFLPEAFKGIDAITKPLDYLEKKVFNPFDIYGRQYYEDAGNGYYKKRGYDEPPPIPESYKHGGWLDTYSTEGYKRNSPDKDNPFNIIPSGNITMQDVDHPVYGIDNLGNEQMMYPGADYTFPGNIVIEIPLKQYGGWLDQYQPGGTVSELWKQKTGLSWPEAKRQGLTDGSYNANLNLRKRLLDGDFDPREQEVFEGIDPEDLIIQKMPVMQSFQKDFDISNQDSLQSPEFSTLSTEPSTPSTKKSLKTANNTNDVIPHIKEDNARKPVLIHTPTGPAVINQSLSPVINNIESKKEEQKKKKEEDKSLYSGCVHGACAEYSKQFGVSRENYRKKNNLFGSAWEIGNNKIGSDIWNPSMGKLDYSNLKEGDFVNLSRESFKTDEEKKIPTKSKNGKPLNQHIGYVTRIEDGVPIIRHYVGGDKVLDEPINNISKFVKYNPTGVFRTFKSDVSEENIPAKIDLIVEPNNVQKKIIDQLNENSVDYSKKFGLTKDEYELLAPLAYSIIGVESKFGASKRTASRMALPNWMQKAYKKMAKDYDENMNPLSEGYGSFKKSNLYNIGEKYPDHDPDKRLSPNEINKKVRHGEVDNLSKDKGSLYSHLEDYGLLREDINTPEESITATLANIAHEYKKYKTKHPEVNADQAIDHVMKKYGKSKQKFQELYEHSSNLKLEGSPFAGVNALNKKYLGDGADLMALKDGDKTYYPTTTIIKPKAEGWLDKFTGNEPKNYQARSLDKLSEQIYSGISQLGVAGKETLENVTGEAAGQMRNLMIKAGVPVNAAQFVADLAGSEKEFTEKQMPESTLNILKDIVRENVAKGKLTLEYSDYKSHNEAAGESKNSDVKSGMGWGKFIEKMGNDRFILKSLLGQATIKDLGNGEYEVIDQFNFNDWGKSFGLFDDLQKRGMLTDPYGLFRTIGRNLGSPDGEGSPVRIRFRLD
jgi:hypothetical protein